MKVLVVGAGALGAVYGVRLALHGNVDVVFMVRNALSTAPLVIERGKNREKLLPARVDSVPDDADVIMLTVGTEDLLSLTLRGDAPIVVITPMLTPTYDRMKERYGVRLRAALPNVISYKREDGVVRWWKAPAPTKIDERPKAAVVEELVTALGRAGLHGKLALGVHEANPATTVRYIAIGMAIAAAGGVKELVADKALLALTARACSQGATLSNRIGAPEAWAFVTPILSAPWALELWLGHLPAEALHYADAHFGSKLIAQHRMMLEEMIAMAAAKGVPHDGFEDLAKRLT